MDEGSQHCREGRYQDHPQEKEMQKAKWLFEEGFPIGEKRTETQAKEKRKDIPV